MRWPLRWPRRWPLWRQFGQEMFDKPRGQRHEHTAERPLGEGGATPTPAWESLPPRPNDHDTDRTGDGTMPLIKPRPNRVKYVKHNCRLQEPNRDTLVLYARCIGDTPDYVLDQ